MNPVEAKVVERAPLTAECVAVSLDYGLCTSCIRISVIEPAHRKMQSDSADGLASRLRLLRRFAPASLVDAGVRKDLELDAPVVSQ